MIYVTISMSHIKQRKLTGSPEQLILETARRILARDGVAGLTMDRLAEKTRVSRATIYRIAGSKQGILQRLSADGDGGPVLSVEAELRKKVLGAARTLFVRHGIEAVTMEQVAGEAGIGVATLYRHFSNKQTLIEEFLLEYRPDHLFYGIDVNKSEEMMNELKRFVEEMVTYISDNRDIFWLSLLERGRNRELFTEMKDTPVKAFENLSFFLRGLIDTGKLRSADINNMAAALMGMIMSFGLLAPVFMNFTPPSNERAGDFICKLFLEGFGKEKL